MVWRDWRATKKQGELEVSLFSKIFGEKHDNVNASYFKTLTAYQPAFRTWNGQLYESELVRSSIHAKAKHIGKLKIEIIGSAKPKLQSKLKKKPNEFQTWTQFLYRLSTILDMQNTAFIVPVEDALGNTTGVFPVLPTQCDLVEYNNTVWLRYRFSSGDIGAIEFSRCGVMTKFQYKDDVFGENNLALNSTMELININNQGITEAVKSSGTFRFMAKMNNFAKPEDIKKEQKRFTKENLSNDAGAVLLFPNNYSDIQQIKASPYVVDEPQMSLIRTNVFNYFGVNEDIVQNKSFGDSWNAFYEGEIEPFSVQFSEVLTNMLFTEREQAQGSLLIATANRLQYMSNADKLNVSAQMADRGIMSINEIRDIWNLAPVEGGDVRIIRGEYYNSDEKGVADNDGSSKEETE